MAYYDVSNRDNKEDGDHIGVKKTDLTKVSNQNYFVLEHQYGGYDVTCKPFVSHKSISGYTLLADDFNSRGRLGRECNLFWVCIHLLHQSRKMCLKSHQAELNTLYLALYMLEAVILRNARKDT